MKGSWYILAMNSDGKCWLFSTGRGRAFGSEASANRAIKQMQEKDYRYETWNLLALKVTPVPD